MTGKNAVGRSSRLHALKEERQGKRPAQVEIPEVVVSEADEFAPEPVEIQNDPIAQLLDQAVTPPVVPAPEPQVADPIVHVTTEPRVVRERPVVSQPAPQAAPETFRAPRFHPEAGATVAVLPQMAFSSHVQSLRDWVNHKATQLHENLRLVIASVVAWGLILCVPVGLYALGYYGQIGRLGVGCGMAAFAVAAVSMARGTEKLMLALEMQVYSVAAMQLLRIGVGITLLVLLYVVPSVSLLTGLVAALVLDRLFSRSLV
jgi:hypothetical protein